MSDPPHRAVGGHGPPAPEEPPPFGSWRLLYALVVAGLLVAIVLLFALTRAFPPPS